MNAKEAYWYAINVIKGRWPEGEKIIAKDAEYAYLYVENVLKGRWPEKEIATFKRPPIEFSSFLNWKKAK